MSQYENYYSGGGGYMAGGSPMSGGGSPSGGVGRRTEASHSLRPITCKQILEATQAHTDAEWMVDNVEIGQVTLVGQAVSINKQATNCVYWIDDGTGRVEARHWQDSSAMDDESGEGGIREGSYVRVTGGMKMFGAKKYVNATHIRSCPDPNEAFYHLLHAMTVTRIMVKGPPPGPGQEQKAMSGGDGTSAYTSNANGAAAHDPYANLPPIQRKVLAVIQHQTRGDEGLHVANIARGVGGDANDISDAIDKLMDDGYIFSTIDDSHYNIAA